MWEEEHENELKYNLFYRQSELQNQDVDEDAILAALIQGVSNQPPTDDDGTLYSGEPSTGADPGNEICGMPSGGIRIGTCSR